jgi:hypothetical protein
MGKTRSEAQPIILFITLSGQPSVDFFDTPARESPRGRATADPADHHIRNQLKFELEEPLA